MASTSAFFTVLFENLFLFLLGVFAGGGTTLFYAVYIVAQTVKSCDKLLNGSSLLADQSNSSSPAPTSCYSLFTAFIGALVAVALAFALGKSWRYCQRQDSSKITEQKTIDQSEPGNQSDTEAENSLQTSSERGGGKAKNHFLTPRLASTLIPSNLDSKSNTSIRTDATLKRK